MSVYRRGDSWYVNITIKGIRIARKAGSTKKEALEVQSALRERARQERLRTRSLVPFADAATKYLLHIKDTLSARTYEMDLMDYENHLAPVFRAYLIQDLSDDVLLTFQRRQKKKGLSNRTVNIHVGLIRKIVNFSKVETKLKYPMLREPKKLHAFLTPEEAGALLSLTREGYKGPVSRKSRHMMVLALARIQFGILTGLRPAELAFLSWEDINFEMGHIRIRSKPASGWMIKTDEERIVDLSPESLDILTRLRAMGKGPWVFSPGKKPVLSIRRSLRTATKAAGIGRDITPNMLRHTFATLSLAAGASSYAVKEILGHRSLSTTEKYLEALSASKRSAVNCLATFLQHPQQETEAETK